MPRFWLGAVVAYDEVRLLRRDGLRERRVSRRCVPGRSPRPRCGPLFSAISLLWRSAARPPTLSNVTPTILPFWTMRCVSVADRLAGDLEHHAGAVGVRLRGRQRVEHRREAGDDRHADLAHLGDHRTVRAGEAQAEDAEHLVALDLLLGGRDRRGRRAGRRRRARPSTLRPLTPPRSLSALM